MKNPFHIRCRTRGVLFALLLAVVLLASLRMPLHAQGSGSTPLLTLTSGLPGKQVRLSWPAEIGLRYRIEKSTTLANGGVGGWAPIALVEAASPEAVWLDPEPTAEKAFYRVSRAMIEVVSISPPLLSPSGGELLIAGQRIPAGSFVVLQVEGQSPVSVPLESLGNGLWRASVVGSFVPGGSVICASIIDGSGTTLLTFNQPLTVTETGRATDTPATLPPGAPVPQQQSNPIPGIGIVVKHHPKPKGSQRTAAGNELKGEMCDDGNSSELIAFWLSKKGYDRYISQSDSARYGPQTNPFCPNDGGDHDSAFVSKKGYQYWKAMSDMASAGAHSNPYFKDNSNQGEMPGSHRRMANIKHPDLARQAMGASAISPVAGLPGEVCFQTCDLTLETPAGPPLAWVQTYRSKDHGSSGGSGTAGSHWEACYDIRIEPIPISAGSSASRIWLFGGDGRRDLMVRQPDGSFRCDGMFREGRFTNGKYGLVFADQGSWTFHPFDGSPQAGKIDKITDRNGVTLDCGYIASGRLGSVSNPFGQSLAMTYNSAGKISDVADQTGRHVSYIYYNSGEPGGNAGDLKSISCPQVGGTPAAAGLTTFTYTSGNTDPNLNGNLLGITDGAGRLLDAFTYSATTSSLAIDYDTCASHNRNGAGGGGLSAMLHFELLSSGNYRVIENDEIGRVTEAAFDRLHRVTSVKQFTGFSTPGIPVTSSANRPTGKLRTGDPDYYQTACAYNADSLCTSLTRADGSQELVTYEHDLKPDCPVRARGNSRVVLQRVPSYPDRTISFDHLPGFGTPESSAAGKKGYDYYQSQSSRGGGAAVAGGIAGGVVAGIVVAARAGQGDPKDEDCDSGPDDCNDLAASEVEIFNDPGDQGATMLGRAIGGRQKAWLCANFRLRMVSAHGQVSTWSYDAHGNCTSALSPLPGRGSLYQYNSIGRLTSRSILNGPGPSLRDECVYDAATGFCSSVVCDKSDSGTGLQLTTSFVRDALGRVTRMINPRGDDWLYTYNALDQCVRVQSPSMPNRISMNVTIDSGGRAARCDFDHRGPDGAVNATNPAYSTFYVYDSRARLIEVAEEDRPVDCSGVLAPATVGIENFAVCDITYNNSGECVRLSTPAACRGQANDRVRDFSYDETGRLFRCADGGLGAASAVTTQYDYDAVGAVVRCAKLGAGVASPEMFYTYDGFHQLTSTTDPMGNVCLYGYSNNGSVTMSCYGEVNDVPGSAGNVLLSKVTSRTGEYLPAHNFKLEIDGISHGNPLTEPGLEVDHAINTKGTGGNNGRLAAAFLDVEVEDDTVTVERFSPGDPAPHATEVTVVDRSPAGLVQAVTCNGDPRLTCAYDSAGRPVTCSNGACTIVRALDACGNPTACGRTDHFRTSGLPEKTFTVSRILDPLGRCVQTTDGTGNTAHYSWDSLGRCVSWTKPGGLVVHSAYDGSATTGPFSQEISADADGDGTAEMLSRNLVRSGECRSTTDSYGYSTWFTSDALGRTTRCDYPDGTFEGCSFDSLGRTAVWTCQDGGVLTTGHDRNGRVVSRAWSNTALGAIPVSDTTFTLDGLGRCVRAEQGTSVILCGYDSIGNATSEMQDGHSITRTFNHRGRTSITYPDGRQFRENRDELGLPLSISAVGPDGLPASPPVVLMEYAGQRVSRSIQGNGVVTACTYRGDGEASPPGTPDFSFDACVQVTISDAASNLLAKTNLLRTENMKRVRVQSTLSPAALAPGRSKSFTLDRLGREVGCVTRRRETAGGRLLIETDVSYTLDLEGRRLTSNGGMNPGTYLQESTLPPGDRQMGQYTSWPRGPVRWDENGNLSLMTTATGQLTCVHDADGRLAQINGVKGQALVGYHYDALGRRADESRPSPTTGNLEIVIKYLYDEQDCIQELAPDGLADMTFVSSGGLKQCISTRNGTIYYPHGGLDRAGASTSNEFRFAGKYLVAGASHRCGSGLSNAGCFTALLTNASGAAVERYDCDDAGSPVFLTSDGLPSSAIQSSVGFRWMAPENIWEPASRFYLGSGGAYGPDLGQPVSFSKMPTGFQAKTEPGVWPELKGDF